MQSAELLVPSPVPSSETIQVTGVTALPTVELFDSDEGLIFGLTPAATAMQPEEPANVP